MSVLARQSTVASGTKREYGHVAALSESVKVLFLSPVERFTKTRKLGRGSTAGLRTWNEYHIAAGSEPFNEPERSIHIDEAAKTPCEQSYLTHLRYMVWRSNAFREQIVERARSHAGQGALARNAAEGVGQVTYASALVARE